MELDYLYSRIAKAKNDLLMEEPCPMYEPPWEAPTNDTSNERRSEGDD